MPGPRDRRRARCACRAFPPVPEETRSGYGRACAAPPRRPASGAFRPAADRRGGRRGAAGQPRRRPRACRRRARSCAAHAAGPARRGNRGWRELPRPPRRARPTLRGAARDWTGRRTSGRCGSRPARARRAAAARRTRWAPPAPAAPPCRAPASAPPLRATLRTRPGTARAARQTTRAPERRAGARPGPAAAPSCPSARLDRGFVQRPLDGGDVVAGDLDLLSRQWPVLGPDHEEAVAFLVDPLDAWTDLDHRDVRVDREAEVEDLDRRGQAEPPVPRGRGVVPLGGGAVKPEGGASRRSCRAAKRVCGRRHARRPRGPRGKSVQPRVWRSSAFWAARRLLQEKTPGLRDSSLNRDRASFFSAAVAFLLRMVPSASAASERASHLGAWVIATSFFSPRESPFFAATR